MSQPRYYDNEKTPLDFNANVASTQFVHPPNPPSLQPEPKKSSWKRRVVRGAVLVGLVMWMCEGEKEGALKGDEKEVNEFGLPDNIPGHLVTPFTWGPVEPYEPHPSSNDSSTETADRPALVSSLAEPLTLSSSSTYDHFLKIIGKQSVGEVTFVSGEKGEKDLVVSVRAIWREEDEEWGTEELERVEGGVIEDEEEGGLGVGILTEPPHPRTPNVARHPHQRTEERQPTLHFKVVVSVPAKFEGKSFEVVGGVFPVRFEDLKKANFGDLKVHVGVGAVVAENLLTSTTNITNSVGPILGNFSVSSNLTLLTPVGPIFANISLLPSSSPSIFNLTLVSLVGHLSASVLSPIPANSVLHASALTEVGAINLTLPSKGYQGDFFIESHIGKVALDVVPVEGKIVTVREVKGKWWGGKATGEVEWLEEKKSVNGSVVVKSQIGSVALKL